MAEKTKAKMPNRIIRDDILQSERFLRLPSDTHRLLYLGSLLLADDFGNMEGEYRLYRNARDFTQIKTEEDLTKVMSDLQDGDLVRRYEFAEKEYWHIPRFKNHRTYWARKFPKSPWCSAKQKTTNELNQEDTKNPASGQHQASIRPASGLSNGVGEGWGGVGLEREGEVEVQNPSDQPPLVVITDISKQPCITARSEKTAARATRLKPDWKLPKTWGQWAMESYPALTDEEVRLQADNFRDFWIAVPGAKGLKLDWEATWRNRIREVAARPGPARKFPSDGQWWTSNAGVDAKGKELGITARGGESYESFKTRIFEALKVTK